MSNFDRIAGYEKEKAELAALVEIFNNRKKYELKGASLPRGIIFYGEAGTGKTLFADVLAKECSLNQVKISLSESTTENSICKQIRKAFLKGTKGRTPTMIFFDEMDKVLPNDREEYYSDRAKSILTQLLTFIDGMDRASNVVFVATCNDYAALPDSIVRPGRFDKKIGFGLPDPQSRTAILQMYMDGAPASFAMKAESISKITGGFSCAALKTLVNECLLRSDENNFVSEELIRTKIVEIKSEDIPTERSEQSYTVDAVRNVGAFIVSRAYSNSGYVLTVEDDTVCNGFLDALVNGVEDYDDYDDYDEDYYEENHSTKEESSEVFCKNDYLAALCALVGGYAAEELVFNKVYDNVWRNMMFADNVLIKMAECGMFGLDAVYIDDRYTRMPYPPSHYEKINKLFSDAMLEAYKKARALLEKNQPLISILTTELVKRKSIEKRDCEAIIAQHGGIRTE